MSITSVEDREKFSTLQKYLLDEYVLVHVDPTRDGVKVPESLAKNPTVTLKLSKLFRGNLKIEKRLVTAELLFGQEYFECQIPLAAIWGVTTAKGQTLLWPTSVPQEILQTLAAAPAAAPGEAAAPGGDGSDPSPPAAGEETRSADHAPQKKLPVEKKRGHLRLVK